jgi:integrase
LTHVRGDKRYRREVISEEEFKSMLERAAKNQPHPYYVLRDRALLCILWKTGKRRGEIVQLEVDDLEIDRQAGLLHITFTVLKKRKGQTLTLRRTKTLMLDDPYAEPIIEYFKHLRRLCPDSRYLFPSTRWNPATETLTIIPDRHISGRQIHNIVVRAGPETWPHLFRETQGAKVVQRYGNTITGAFAVKQRLDLESIQTAMRYVERYAIDLIEPEETVLE